MSSLNAKLELSTRDTVFINAFAGKDTVYDRDCKVVTLAKQDLLDRIFDIVEINGTERFELGQYTGPTTSISIDELNVHDNAVTEIEYKVIGAPSVVNAISRLLEGNTYTSKRVEGVYDIAIRHWYYKAQRDALDCNRIMRDTTDFDKLTVAMYPRIDIPEMMDQFVSSDESIIIMSGQPGTGKTCFAKMAMREYANIKGRDISVVYVKDREVLRKDEFWVAMTSQEPDLIILDDLDNELLPRGAEGNPIVSNMLSFSDGIFDISTKILITTNLTDSRIDKALVRPGRSFDTICLPQLNREEAINIWTGEFNESSEEFTRRFGELESISQAALVSENARAKKSGVATYLRDPSISVRKLVEEGETISLD